MPLPCFKIADFVFLLIDRWTAFMCNLTQATSQLSNLLCFAARHLHLARRHKTKHVHLRARRGLFKTGSESWFLYVYSSTGDRP